VLPTAASASAGVIGCRLSRNTLQNLDSAKIQQNCSFKLKQQPHLISKGSEL
jgi:hypothetical protein